MSRKHYPTEGKRPVPDTNPGLERARALHDLIASEAPASEALGRLTDKVAEALIEADMFSLLLPREAGGLELSLPEYFETIEDIAAADGSAAWCFAICNATVLMFHRAGPEQGKQEVFANGPVPMWVGLVPRATSAPAEGGHLVSGKFGWGSGSSLSDWVLVTEPLPDRDGMQWFRSYVLPKSDVAIVPDSWQPLGLKATASVDYVIEGAFVPAHRSFEYPLMDMSGTLPMSTFEGAVFHGIGMAAFASGVARRATSEMAAAASKVQRMKASASQAQDEAIQQGMGETEARFISARSHYLGLLAEQDRHWREHGRTSREIVRQCLYALNVLSKAARDSAIFAFDNAGTAAILVHDPIQRCLRDLFAGLKHPVFGAIHVRDLGKEMLGADAAQMRLK